MIYIGDGHEELYFMMVEKTSVYDDGRLIRSLFSDTDIEWVIIMLVCVFI